MKYAEYVNRLFAKSAKRGIPLSGTFELTARCNLRCRMCYIHREENDGEIKTDEFSSEEWLNIAKEAQQCGMLFLLLTGGEPFIRPDFEEIYRRCRELGIIVSINTNGTMIGEKQVELLRKLPPQRVNITLYGASEATYEKLCRSGSAFERAYRAVAMLTEAGVPVKINYSVTPYNIGDLDAVERFANEHNLPLQAATYMFRPSVRMRTPKFCPAKSANAKPAKGSRLRNPLPQGGRTSCERLTRRLLKNVRKLLHSTRIFRLPKRSAAIFRRSVYAAVRELRRFGSHTTGSFAPAE